MIVDIFRQEGFIFVNNWVEVANHVWPKRSQDYDWASVCAQATAGIDDADLVLAEASGETGFGVGFEVASALSKGKKVVILIQRGQVSDSYASGLNRSDLLIYEYDPANIVVDLQGLVRSIEKM
jgi:hypothetical protein